MSIKETLEKIKPFYTLLVISLVAFIFFILGQLSAKKPLKEPLNIRYPTQGQTANVISVPTSSTTLTSPTISEDAPVIGSKSGKKYYFPWCGTVKRIKPENQVKFDSIAEAKKAGFVAGGNCKGLY